MKKAAFLRQACFLGMTLVVLGGAGLFGMFVYIARYQCIDFSMLEYYSPGRPSVLVDCHGREWARFQLDRREPITLANMPPHLINAFVATEDWSFFKHNGLSWKGIVRSIAYNIYYGRKVQGASTITQQLVRLLFFDARKTFSRKVQEQWYALLVEQQFTKEQILEAYLNHVYFGCGIYGVEAASQRFWGKPARELTIAQAATLAGIVRSPGNYCPLLYMLSAQKRRNVVLRLMHKLGYISDQEYEHARQQDLSVVGADATCCAPHLRESLRQQLEDLVGKEQLYTGGLVVQTTLDLDLQQKAELSFSHHVYKLRQDLLPDIDGALLSLDVETGEIRALVGGLDFKVSSFNRALQARRQLGSIFKPMLYAEAVAKGHSLDEVLVDEPFSMKMANGQCWEPKNYNERFVGPMTLARALTYSNNIIAIKLLLSVGVERVYDLARASHLQQVPGPYPSLALGCIDATLKEAAGMFNILANHGVYVEPHGIRWIKNSLGEKIWRHTPCTEKVFSADVTDKIAKVLMAGFDRLKSRWKGTAVDCQVFSKTGTTNDSRTCWFAGSTPQLTTVVYIGCDDNKALGKNVFSPKTAFPIWMGLHSQLTSSSKKFSFDPQLHEVTIDTWTGERVDGRNPHGMQIFL